MTQIIQPFRTTPMLEKLAAFTERRQDVLAGNIANISTPGYKTRDLPVNAFQEALKKSIARRETPTAPLFDAYRSGTQPAAGSATEFPAELFRAVERPTGDLTFQDGSNRNVETEVMEMTKNSIVQGFAVELIAAQFNLLQSVITERP